MFKAKPQKIYKGGSVGVVERLSKNEKRETELTDMDNCAVISGGEGSG